MVERTNNNGIIFGLSALQIRFGSIQRTVEIAAMDGGKVGAVTSTSGVLGTTDDLVRFHCLLTKKEVSLSRLAYLGSLDVLPDGKRISRGNVKIAMTIKVGANRTNPVEVRVSGRIPIFIDVLGAVSEDELRVRLHSLFLETTDPAADGASVDSCAEYILHEVKLRESRDTMLRRMRMERAMGQAPLASLLGDELADQ